MYIFLMRNRIYTNSFAIISLIAAIITIFVFLIGIDDHFGNLLKKLGILKSNEVPIQKILKGVLEERERERKKSMVRNETTSYQTEYNKIASKKDLTPSRVIESSKELLQAEQKKEGLIRIVSPDNCLIFINGEKISSKIFKLPIGTHILEVSIPFAWNSPYIKNEIQIRLNETTAMSFLVGELFISCQPFAKIFVDDIYFKETEGGKISKILQGTHKIKIEKNSYPTFEGQFYVKGSIPTRLVIKYNELSKKWELRD